MTRNGVTVVFALLVVFLGSSRRVAGVPEQIAGLSAGAVDLSDVSLPDARAQMFSVPFGAGTDAIEIGIPTGFSATDCKRCAVTGASGKVQSVTATGEPGWIQVKLAEPATTHGAVTAMFWNVHGEPAVKEHFVASDGKPDNEGTESSPWDVRSALDGTHAVEPGSIVWFSGGTYSEPRGASGLDRAFAVALAGAADRPIHLRPLPGARVVIEGGFRVDEPASHLWVGGFEFHNPDPVPGGEPTPPGSVPEPLPKGFDEWGGAGVAVFSGDNHVVYNNSTRGGGHGFSAWNGATNTVFLANVAFDSGWLGTDRAHGHCIYAQNLPETGTKVVRQNLFAVRDGRSAPGNYALHLYATRPVLGGFEVAENAVKGPVVVQSRQAHCERIRFENNVIQSVLIGQRSETDGKGSSFGMPGLPDRRLTITDNVFIDGTKRLENNGWEDVMAERNRVVKTKATWWAVDIGGPPGHAVKESGEFQDFSDNGGKDEFQLWRNPIDLDRAHVAIMDWDRDGVVEIDVGRFLEPGDRYRFLHYRELSGIYSGDFARHEGVFSKGPLSINIIEVGDALDMFVLFKHR